MLAPYDLAITTVIGCFEERTYGKAFEYRTTTNPWAIDHKLYHEIFVLDGVRFGNVLKTVAYVCTDEDATGQPVIEKWFIKHQWLRPERDAHHVGE